MASPVKSTVQEHIYKECLERIEELTAQANIDLQDIKTKYETEHTTNEIEYFKVTLDTIKHRARTTYNGLCTWKTPTKNQDESNEAPNEGKEMSSNINSQNPANSRTEEVNNAEENSNPLQVSPAPPLRNCLDFR